MLKIENLSSRFVRSAKSVTARGKDGIWMSDVRKPATTWPFASGTEGRTGSPERGSGPRGLRTARVTAECWGCQLEGRRKGCCQLEWTAQDLPPRARAIYTPPIHRRRVVVSPAHSLTIPAVARVSNNSTADSSTAPPPLLHNEKTEKSSLSFARRSVSDGSHRGWQGW